MYNSGPRCVSIILQISQFNNLSLHQRSKNIQENYWWKQKARGKEQELHLHIYMACQ